MFNLKRLRPLIRNVEVKAPIYTFYGALTNTDYVWGDIEDKADDPVGSSAETQTE